MVLKPTLRIGHQAVAAIDRTPKTVVFPDLPQVTDPAVRSSSFTDYRFHVMAREAGHHCADAAFSGGPLSPQHMLQEFAEEPWQVLLAASLLYNNPRPDEAHAAYWMLRGLCGGDSGKLVRLSNPLLAQIVKSCGHPSVRVKTLKLMALRLTLQPLSETKTLGDAILKIPGCGDYARQSWELFVMGEIDVCDAIRDAEMDAFRRWAVSVGCVHERGAGGVYRQVLNANLNFTHRHVVELMYALARKGGVHIIDSVEVSFLLAERGMLDLVKEMTRLGPDLVTNASGKRKVRKLIDCAESLGLIQRSGEGHRLTYRGYRELEYWMPGVRR